MKTITKISALAITGLMLTGCGGSSSSGTTLQGTFKDANVDGVSYVSSFRGVTKDGGKFNYQAGDNIAFSIGGIVLGTTKAKASIQIADLVGKGTESETNIARLLQSLDFDSNPNNGINIHPGVLSAAANFMHTFTSATDTFSVGNIISAIEHDTKTYTIVSSDDAREHLNETAQCEYAGAYTDSGVNGALVHADGTVQLFVGSAAATGKSSVIDYGLATYATTTGGYTVTLDNVNMLTVTQGTETIFIASRLDQVRTNDVDIRLTGEYLGSDVGFFSARIVDNRLSANVYSSAEGESFTASGLLNPDTNTLTFTGDVNKSAFTGTINIADNNRIGTTEGNWAGDELSGTFTGTACILNTPAGARLVATSEDDSVSGGFAPADKAAFAAKYSALTLTSGGDSFSSAISATMLTRNSDSATTSYVYTKTGANTATITGTTIGSFGFGDLTLTFASATAGTYVENDSTNSEPFSLTPR